MTKKMGKCNHSEEDVFDGTLNNNLNRAIEVKMCIDCGTILDASKVWFKKLSKVKCRVV